jgi:glycogen synthase
MHEPLLKITQLSNPLIRLQEKYKLQTETQLPSVEVVLRRAAAIRGLKDVKNILKKAINLNINAVFSTKARASIHWAVIKGRIEIFWLIVLCGGDINLKDGSS